MEEGNSGSAPGKARRLRVIIAAIYYFNGDKKKFLRIPGKKSMRYNRLLRASIAPKRKPR